MAATSFSFISGSPNCDHRAGGLLLSRPRWREATRICHVASRRARSLNARSCNYPTTCALQRPTRRSDHANLREDRCNIGRSWRNRSRQRGSSRSLVRLLSSSLLPSSLWLLSPSLLSPSLWLLSSSLLRLSPLLPSSLLPPSLLVLARSFNAASL